MNLSIRSVTDAGDLEKERVIMVASGVTDIGKYQVADTRAITDGVNSEIKRIFWLPDKKVKANDVVVLYTKAGKANEKANQNGTISHFFYWGLGEAIWTPGRACVLIRVADWAVERVETAKGG
jgi:hypothetical protein